MAGKRNRAHQSANGGDSSKSQKKPRVYNSQDEGLASLYNQLAEDDSNVRLRAASQLVASVLNHEDLSQESVHKALKRLIRGLCSSRKSARLGFFLALTELVRQLFADQKNPLVSKSELFALLQDCTKLEGQPATQEKRNYAFGRLYACRSLFRSGCISQSADDFDIWVQVVEHVADQAKILPWIREETGMVLCDAMKPDASESFFQPFVTATLATLQAKNLLYSPEGVAIWLTIRRYILNFSAYPSDCWHQNDPLHSSNAFKFNRAMREQYDATYENDAGHEDAPKPGVWQQALSNSWIIVVESALSAPDRDVVFNTTWKSLIDGALLSEKASPERKFWGFQLFSKTIKIISKDPQMASLVKVLFTPALIRCLIDNTSASQKLLHSAARDCLKAIKSAAQTNSSLALPIIQSLVQKPGTPIFDRLTNSKTLEQVLSGADDTVFIQVVKFLDTILSSPSTSDPQQALNSRHAIADIITGAIKGRSKNLAVAGLVTPPEWISKPVHILARHSYCIPISGKIDKLPNPPISADTRAVFHSRLVALFSHLLSLKAPFVAALAWSDIKMIRSKTQSSKPSVRLVLEADKPIHDLVDKASNIVEVLVKKAEEDSGSNSIDESTQALIVLFCLTLLQIYSGDESAVTELLDLIEFYEATTAPASTSTEHFDLLLELLIGLLSRESSLFRTMAENVFTAITARVSYDGLKSMLEILQTSESVIGQAQLFKAADEEQEAMDLDNSDSDAIASDVEVIDGPGSADEDSDSDSINDSDSNDDEDDAAPDDALNQKLAALLKTTNPAEDSEDEGSASDSSMDDDAMLAIDSQLAQIFKARRIDPQKNKERKAARGNVVNLKRRVLDLLVIYAKQEFSNPLSLNMLLPLLQLMRTTHEKSLENKAGDVLKQYYSSSGKIKSSPLGDGSSKQGDSEHVWDILKEVHREVQRASHSKAHSAACSRASLFAARALLQSSSDHKATYARVMDEYAETQRAWFSKRKSPIQPTFFTEWISWSSEMRKRQRS